jgi:hypothetical protein
VTASYRPASTPLSFQPRRAIIPTNRTRKSVFIRMHLFRTARPLPLIAITLSLIAACLLCAALPATVWAASHARQHAYPNAARDMRCNSPAGAFWVYGRGFHWSRSSYLCFVTTDTPQLVDSWYRQAGWTVRSTGKGTVDHLNVRVGRLELQLVRDQATLVRGDHTRIYVHLYVTVGMDF